MVSACGQAGRAWNARAPALAGVVDGPARRWRSGVRVITVVATKYNIDVM
jgi:hypothetical protein